jgi:hypothetical protein
MTFSPKASSLGHGSQLLHLHGTATICKRIYGLGARPISIKL